MTKTKILRGLYHLTVICAGFTTLALEIITSRMLMPQYGVTMDIWGVVLSVTLLALALGYYYGERLTQKVPVEMIPGKYVRNAFLAALFIFAGMLAFYPFVNWLGSISIFIGALLASTVLIGPCFFFTASLTPLLVMVESSSDNPKKAAIGHAGFILAESTLGSVLGALVCVYLLIPAMAIELALIYMVAPLFVTASILLILHSRFMNWKIRGIQLLVMALAGAVFFSGVQADARQIPFGQTTATQLDIQRTPYGTIRVVKVPIPREHNSWLYLLLDGRTQNVMLEDGTNAAAYTNVAVNVLLNQPKKPKSVLVLGGGAGAIARDLANRGVAVDVVEINGAFEKITKKYFYMTDKVNFITADARMYLNHCPKKYDAIVFDVYTGYGVPEHMVTKEAYQSAKQCLNSGGLVSLNILRDPNDHIPDEIIKASLSSVFTYVDLYSPIKAITPIVNGIWLASDDTLSPAVLSGGTTPDFINKDIVENWKYLPVDGGGAVSTDSYPVYVFKTKDLYRQEHDLTRDVYGLAVMKP